MKKIIAAAARITAVASVLSVAAIAGQGTAGAAPQDCVVNRTLLDASAVCAPDGGSGYVLHVDCFGLYASGPFPLYGIGHYAALSYPFTPDGQRITTGCTGMGPGVAAVVTGAYVEVYRG